MSLYIHPVEAFDDNYIWVLVNESNNQAIVVDPGQADPVAEFLAQKDLELTAIWVTHKHHDHTDGVDALREMFPMTHVVAHTGHDVSPDQTVSEGSTVSAWGYSAQVWDVAGHTENHIAYLLDRDGTKHVFCGDTLFSGGCGRVFSGTIEGLFDSLTKFTTLTDDTLFYPAHEYTVHNLKFGLSIVPNDSAMQTALNNAKARRQLNKPTLPVTLAHEKSINVFLRTKDPAVIEGVKAKANLPDTKPLSVFTALRRLKDSF